MGNITIDGDKLYLRMIGKYSDQVKTDDNLKFLLSAIAQSVAEEINSSIIKP